jgi:hypothetical protein
MSGSKRRATYEDLETVPPHCVGEIVDGELYVSPRPASPQGRAASRLGMLLGGPFDLGEGGPGGWLIVDEPELHLGNDALVPDLAGWRRERMPEMPQQGRQRGLSQVALGLPPPAQLRRLQQAVVEAVTSVVAEHAG